jgi:hypothetical protein
MLRIKVTIQAAYCDETEINHKTRITIGTVAPALFAKKYSPKHSPTNSKTFSVAVKKISECEKCTSLSPLFFFVIENGASPRNLDR